MTSKAIGIEAGSNLVYVCGNIAAGKSTTSRLLREQLQARLVHEDIDGNPYLSGFYSDMPRWSFHVDAHFLASRVSDVLREWEPGGTPVIFDRCYLEGEVFATVAHRRGATTPQEASTFALLLADYDRLLPPPAMLVYLRADPVTLRRRVAERGRGYEEHLELGYLQELQEEYESWFDRYRRSPKLRLDTRTTELRDNPDALHDLVARVAESLGESAPPPPRPYG